MKNVNYEIADACIEMAFNPEILDAKGYDEHEVIRTFNSVIKDIEKLFGMSCKVTRHDRTFKGERIFTIDFKVLYEDDIPGADKENGCQMFLELLAEFEATVREEEESLSYEGVRFDVKVADYHKLDYNRHYEIMRIPFTTKDSNAKFAGDAMLIIWLNVDRATELYGQDRAMNYIHSFNQLIHNEIHGSAPYANVLSEPVNQGEHIWGYRLRFVKFNAKDNGENQQNMLVRIKEFYNELTRYMEPLSNLGDVEIYFNGTNEQFYNNVQFQQTNVEH